MWCGNSVHRNTERKKQNFKYFTNAPPEYTPLPILSSKNTAMNPCWPSVDLPPINPFADEMVERKNAKTAKQLYFVWNHIENSTKILFYIFSYTEGWNEIVCVKNKKILFAFITFK